MINSDALHLWGWQLFSIVPGVSPIQLKTIQTQIELLDHHKIRKPTYKLFIQALIHAGGDDQNLEFSISISALSAMTGLSRTSVTKCWQASIEMGHISYTHRLTYGTNPGKRTGIYRLSAFDKPNSVESGEPQIRMKI